MLSTTTANLIMTYEPAILMAFVTIAHIVYQVADTKKTLDILQGRDDKA